MLGVRGGGEDSPKEGAVMPFKKVSKNAYKSPSGRTFTKKQVAMYHATDGFKKKPKKVTGKKR